MRARAGLLARVAQPRGRERLMGEPGRSAEQYLQALDLMPDVPQLRVEAIQALIAADRLAEAQASLRRVATLVAIGVVAGAALSLWALTSPAVASLVVRWGL